VLPSEVLLNNALKLFTLTITEALTGIAFSGSAGFEGFLTVK